MPWLQQHDEFISQLSDMYEASRESGSVSIMMKKVTASDLKVNTKSIEKNAPSEGTTRASQAELLAECPAGSTACLVRAVLTGGKRLNPKKSKRKISTLVIGNEQGSFHERLVLLNKAQMDGLQKRQKKKKKKAAK